MKRPLTILLAGPRGFCAGVDRAVQIVEQALARHGAPVFVRHEIVHNRHVVEQLKKKGAIFVEDLAEVPDHGHVVFSAHGVPKSVPAEASRRGLAYFDATCPLVSKVHREAERHFADGRTVVLIGHEGHPEVEGTIGQLPPGAVLLVETVDDVAALSVEPGTRLAYCTQTTLSIDDTASLVAALKARFPNIAGPRSEDICYATTNRQLAVKAVANRVDAMLVVGSPSSSNSNRLVEMALSQGCAKAMLVEDASAIDWRWLDGVRRLGVTAGASAPEALVQQLVEAARLRFDVTLEETRIAEESVVFKLPRALVA
jgi:4-hydroxy-3-methylbut-2-enyl diphosphate reductase